MQGKGLNATMVGLGCILGWSDSSSTRHVWHVCHSFGKVCKICSSMRIGVMWVRLMEVFVVWQFVHRFVNSLLRIWRCSEPTSGALQGADQVQ
jgi:hypothetical protein